MTRKANPALNMPRSAAADLQSHDSSTACTATADPDAVTAALESGASLAAAPQVGKDPAHFWEYKTLEQMTDAEWEAVCDGCAKCCLNKIIHDDDEAAAGPTDYVMPDETVYFTNIACQYLNSNSCECTKYQQRTVIVPDCIKLTKENIKDIFFMPPSCSYRRLQEGRGLPSWHPLLNNGKKSLMHKKQMSVRNKTLSETQVHPELYEDYIVTWPLNDLD